MSNPPSLRDRVHEQLTAIVGPDGPLAFTPPAVSAFLASELLVAVAAEYRARQVRVAHPGRAVVVTAGPPGAGKSTAVTEMAPDYRRIDPDEIKSILLDRLERAGLLIARHSYELQDGGVVQPGEFSRWVHEASTRISSLVRRESLALGENIVVEGTLAWEPLVQTHLVELIDYEYEHLAILNVEVPRDIAIEQARQRWWADRTSGTALGGRFMPDSAFDAFYPEHDGVSTCTRNARRMFEQADEIGAFSVELRFLHRTHGSTIHTSVMTAKDVEPWPIDSLREAVEFGASCARCGKPLRDRRSIRRGYGDGCWKLVH